MKRSSRGFTLIELLIVIGILAILATATVLVLNPAQLLAQGRDSNRISDLASLNTSISFYLSDVASPSLGTCPAGIAPFSGFSNVAVTTASFLTNGAVVTASQAVTGGGWIPINFTLISSGSPLAKEPIDPTNSGDFVYRYACNNTNKQYELDAKMESTKYTTAPNNLAATDGGDNATFYEVGNFLSL